MEKNKKIIKLCYLQIAFYVVFLTSLLLHFKRGLDHRAFALLIILTLLGCASALTLTDYLKSLIRRSGFDVAGVHDKKSLEEKLLQLQNADDTLDVGVMMFDMNNLKMINDTYGHEEGDVFIQTFASYLTRILTENSFLARFGGDEFVIVQNHATWNQLEQMNLQLQTMIDTYNQTADHPLSYAVGYELSCKNHYYLIMDLLQMADEHDFAGMAREVEAIHRQTAQPFLLAAVQVKNWNDDLSPWPAPPVWGKQGFVGRAGNTLAWLEQAVPGIRQQYSIKEDCKVILGGYSLAGLFALWAATQTNALYGVAAASPSVWFPGWPEYEAAHPIQAQRVYLSLGDREEYTRNQTMAAVGDNIRALHSALTQRGKDCRLEWNAGGHFKDADLRTARAFAWVMEGKQ